MISIILVNYKTNDQLLDAVASVLTQITADPLEVIVVDNSPADTAYTSLAAQLPHNVTYIQNNKNIGFAKACNQAFDYSNGEFILLLNPDARLLPSALSKLTESLKQHPDAGAVGPRVYWDDDCRFLMPPSTYPSIASFYKEAISRLHPLMSQYSSIDFRKKALQAWTCNTLVPVEALSGGHILIRREAILKCGGLFDPRFFMYWEDTDLMHRLKKAGYRLYLEPEAKCLHYYTHAHTKDHLIAQGWSIFQLKHFRHNKRFRFVNWINKQLPPAATPDIMPITVKHEKLIFPVPSELQHAWLLELGTSPQLIPAIGHFGSGPTAEVDTSLFQRLQDKIYFARLSEPVSRPDLIYYWQWQGYPSKTY
ncbi:Glycosyltransferase, GT2 family [Nitrosomonas aestuarii]|uniref:Glycosyltransferase, GT2 family n=1 Tax=Nitrosomonas aestuarii TaxID=52441 RepID=A0A1I4CG23_9PROT|nr:glycosyltransferase family 2 protein [Nitrosomonas aestuarii]SFK79239.1 Glycosyltransferase, GT2 family [Nitrosomonas aestuarii]